jgi:hypothetical protein
MIAHSFAILLIGLVPSVALAQEPKPIGPPELGVYSKPVGAGTLTIWHASIGRPEVIGAGVSAVLGRESTWTHWTHPQIVEGLLLAGDVGVGGATARVGWSRLMLADAGFGGMSVEALYVRPWAIQWGMRRNDNYVGAGASLYGGFFRLAAGVVRNVSSAGGITPKIELGIIWHARSNKPLQPPSGSTNAD